jgi:mannose-6-phosphate isomerase
MEAKDISCPPMRFAPFVRAMVWGGRRLAVLGKPLAGDDRYGESWDLSDHAMHRSVVAEGPLRGNTLRTLLERDAAGILGPSASPGQQFPWLVKFLDCEDWLSVQVHPGPETVKRLWPGEGSKTEAWFVLDAHPGSRIYAGLLPGVNEKLMRARIAAGKVVDCLHSFAPRSGQCVFLPAGTVHAVGGGVLMAEVQETSDATFRLYDWDRRDGQGKSRTLHVEEALACIDWNQGPIAPVSARGYADSAVEAVRQPLASCAYFRLDYMQGTRPFTCGGEGVLQVLLVLKGHGTLSGPVGDIELSVGQVWLLPAAMERSAIRPAASVRALLCSLPRA